MRPISRVVLVAGLLLVPTTAAADAIDELTPGTWYAIPNTPMRAVCPPDTENYEWSFYCTNVMAAWSGGALDSTRGRLIVWGGGHGDYRGNEVYTFDLHTLEWSRPWGPSDDAQIPAGGTHEVYDDGNPGSRHTYSGLTYVPAPHDALYSMGGSLWQSGFYGAATWSFGFGENLWTRRVEGPPEMSYGDASVFDPITGHIFRRANSRMFEYDPDADTFTGRAESNGGFWATDVAAALDPTTRTMIIVGSGRLDTYDLDTDTYVQNVAVVDPGVEALFGGGCPGVDFDTSQERFVVWGGGLDVYTYDPVTSSFAVHTNEGDDPGSITGSGGAFGRFRYAPSRNAFVWVDNVDANVFVYRMTEGTGRPPPGEGDTSGGSGGQDDTGASADDDGTAGDPSATVTDASATDPTDPTGSAEPTGSTDATGTSAGADASNNSGCGCQAAPVSSSLAWLLLACARRSRRRSQVRLAHREMRRRAVVLAASSRAA